MIFEAFPAIEFEKGNTITRRINNPVKGTRLININTLEGKMDNKQIIENLKQGGYVTRQEALKIIDRCECGKATKFLEKSGVRYVQVGANGHNSKKLYLKKDLDAIPKKQQQQPVVTPSPVGGDFNGGKILAAISDLRRRVSELEQFKNDLEN